MTKYKTNRKVWINGFRKYVERTVYTDGQKYFIKWSGEMVEVYEDKWCWRTVEWY